MELKQAFQNVINACNALSFNMGNAEQALVLKQSLEEIGKALFAEEQSEE
jgi:hypothetical protein